MYYSVIGLLALTVLIITNHDVLLQKPDGSASPVQRIYRRFLFCIMAYYITDILWGVLDSLSLTTLLYADTVVYYLAMAAGILLWTQYAIAYLEHGALKEKGTHSQLMAKNGGYAALYRAQEALERYGKEAAV